MATQKVHILTGKRFSLNSAVRRRGVVALTILAGVLVGTGCGSSEDEAQTQATTQDTSATKTETSKGKASAVSVNVSFNKDKVGQGAKGFAPLIGEWVIERDSRAPSPPNVYSQVGTENKRPEETDAGEVFGKEYEDFLQNIDSYELFPASIYAKASYRNFDASVYFKPISGKIDQAGGIAFRVTDPLNYYTWRCNALENDCRLFIYKDGKRGESVFEAKAQVEQGKWYKIRVVAVGDRIQGYFGKQKLMDFEDSTHPDGRVGLWTKDDSITEFDDFKVKPLR